MALRSPPWTWIRRRLAWRLCLLFVAGALLPVALSDWLVIAVMDGVAQKLDADQRDASGRVLAQSRGADADDAAARAAGVQVHVARLFVDAQGPLQTWTFEQATPRARVDWQHQPVWAWLLAVAAGTLLSVGLIGQSRIRRALAPLERLTAGTRRLNQGDAAARVDIRRDDEIGERATAFNDMATRLQEREAQLYFRAVHDDLTGLANRFGLHQQLERLLHDPAGAPAFAVLFIDLDRFKDVDDRHGHGVGDEVLRQAAQRLRDIPGDAVSVARKGGDEFVVALRGGIRLRVSVNVSPRQFDAGDLMQHVRSALQRHGVEASSLELEVTESVLSGDVSRVGRQLAALRALGVTIAMDDFGTGYSSMALLRTLPIDVMEIDRAFVRDLEHDANAVAIARTIVTLARSLSLRLVAEGVETPGQAAILRTLGCDERQGYLFGRPMPASEFEALPGLRRRPGP